MAVPSRTGTPTHPERERAGAPVTLPVLPLMLLAMRSTGNGRTQLQLHAVNAERTRERV